MKTFTGLILFLFFTGCRNQPQKIDERVKEQSNAENKIAVTVVKKVSDIIPGFKPDFKKTKWKGTIADAVSWVDANGKNVLIISELETDDWENQRPEMKKHLPGGNIGECRLAELFAYHYILPASTAPWKMYWHLNDFEFYCGTDRQIAYTPASLLISDIDSNGIAESCFMYYEKNVRIDLHYTVKMILHTDSAKLKVYGEIGLYKHIVKEWNESLLTPKYSGFENTKPQYYQYAKYLWNNYSRRQDSLDKIRAETTPKINPSGKIK